jgi:hypothetical protein
VNRRGSSSGEASSRDRSHASDIAVERDSAGDAQSRNNEVHASHVVGGDGDVRIAEQSLDIAIGDSSSGLLENLPPSRDKKLVTGVQAGGAITRDSVLSIYIKRESACILCKFRCQPPLPSLGVGAWKLACLRWSSAAPA